MTPTIEVRESGKQFDVVINGVVIGTSKLQCDAQMHKHFLDDLFEEVIGEHISMAHKTTTKPEFTPPPEGPSESDDTLEAVRSIVRDWRKGHPSVTFNWHQSECCAYEVLEDLEKVLVPKS